MKLTITPYINQWLILGVLLLVWLLPTHSVAQSSVDKKKVLLYVEQELKPASKQNIIGTVLKVVNGTSEKFEGVLLVEPPQGVRSISSNQTTVNLAAGDSLFIPYRMMVTPALPAGESAIIFTLTNHEQQVVQQAQSHFSTEEKVSLSLSVRERNMLITNPNDSARVVARVKNNGNRHQDVIVVFSIPTLHRGVNFVEQKASLEPQEEKEVIFSFLPTPELLSQQNFQINISGLRGKAKALFANMSVQVQNASSHQRYVHTGYDFGLYNPYNKNSFSMSHRFTSYSSTGTTQLLGMGSVDLPAGYVGASANLYSYNNGKDIMATNTTLSYRLHRNEIMVGSIYESMALSMSGRGAAVQVGNKKNNTLKVGFVDQQYNVFAQSAIGDYSYSFYALAGFGGTGYDRKGEASLIHQYDVNEKARHTVAGGELNNLFGTRVRGSIKAHAAVSQPFEGNKEQFSGSAEVNYTANIKKIDFSGNYFYSTPYFPGNRRGATYLQQSIYQRADNGSSWRVSGYYSRYAPKSHTIDMTYNSEQISGEFHYYLPKVENVTPGIGYQYQHESSDSYGANLGGGVASTIAAHRLKTSARWNSDNNNHSLMTAYEYGLAFLANEKNELQMKTTVNYAYKWVNLSVMWQQGSFYLSDYYVSQRNNKPYERLMGSISASKKFGSKFEMNAGGNIINDLYSRFSPSAFANVRYNPSRVFSLYTNATWMNYRYKGVPSRTSWYAEVGVTVNLNSRGVSSGRKSNLNILAFHDANANGVFDKGEMPAEGYRVRVNNRTFVTDNKGKATFSRIPFGKYSLGRVSQQGWFANADSIEVKKHRATAYVPLQQAGSVTGEVVLVYDSKTSIDTPPSLEGVQFVATSVDGHTTQRIVTNKEGRFTVFLPKGEYQIEMLSNLLHPDLSTTEGIRKFTVTPGKISKLESFRLNLRQKKVNIRRFTQD